MTHNLFRVFQVKNPGLQDLYDYFPDKKDEKEIIKMIYENNENNFEKSLNELLILFTGTDNEHEGQFLKNQNDEMG